MSWNNETRNLSGGSSEEVHQQGVASGEASHVAQGPSVSNAAVVPQEYNVLTMASFKSLVSSLAQNAVVSQLSHLGLPTLPTQPLQQNIGASRASSFQTLHGDLLASVSSAVASATAVFSKY